MELTADYEDIFLFLGLRNRFDALQPDREFQLGLAGEGNFACGVAANFMDVVFVDVALHIHTVQACDFEEEVTLFDRRGDPLFKIAFHDDPGKRSLQNCLG